MSTSYDRAKHVVEVDERISAVFIVDSIGKISDLFVAEDANINRSFIESIRTTLNIRFEGKKESTKDQPLGQHLCDKLNDENEKINKIHESEMMKVVLTKSKTSPEDIAEKIL